MEIFRLITPILVTITLFVIGMIKSDVDEVKKHFSNHLSEHKSLEVTIEKRFTKLETICGGVQVGEDGKRP